MSHFFGSMMGKKAVSEPPYVPTEPDQDIRDYIVFRGNPRKESAHTFRVDGADRYVESYLDEYPGTTVSQLLSVKQPKWTPEGWLFDGVDDYLTTDQLDFKEVFVVASYNFPNAKDDDGLVTTEQSGFIGSNPIILESGTTNIKTSRTYPIADTMEFKVNNVVTNQLLPCTKKIIVSESSQSYAYTSYGQRVYIGSNLGIVGKSWAGKIHDIIFLYGGLNTEQKTRLYNYLKADHNL